MVSDDAEPFLPSELLIPVAEHLHAAARGSKRHEPGAECDARRSMKAPQGFERPLTVMAVPCLVEEARR